jgi:hypothetical protein
MSVAPVPEESVALWKRFVKPVPVVASPLLVMVAERVMAEFTIAAVGVMGPAVRLGAEIVVEFVQAILLTVCEPEVTVTVAVLVPMVEYEVVVEIVKPVTDPPQE